MSNRDIAAPLLDDGDAADFPSMWSAAGSPLDGGSTAASPASSEDSEERGPLAAADEADAAAGGLRPSQTQPQSKLTGFVLAVILFFNAAGGPFGVEPSLKAAGNLYAIIGFAIMPVLWSLPEAWVTYELSSLYPCASGGVRWASYDTEEAFGESWGMLVGYLGWISGVATNASYPVLFLSYIHSQFFPQMDYSEHNAFVRYGILLGITLVLAFVNYRGLEVVGKVSVLIFFVSMAPFILMFFIGLPKVDPQRWLETPTGETEVFDDDSLTKNGWFPESYLAGVVWRPFINNLYWNFVGMEQGSHYSSSVSKKTLRNGIGGCFVLVSTAYLVPLLIATGATDIQQDEWKAGSFARAGTEIGGAWLGNWIVVSSGCALLASFFAEMTADSMQLMGMADRRQLPSIFGRRSRHDTPTFAILLGLLVILLLLPLPFGTIIELSNFSFCFNSTLQFVVFGQLRIRNGDGSRLRKSLYVLMLIMPTLLNVAVVLLTSYATYIYGASSLVFGLLLVNAKRIGKAWRSFRERGSEEEVEDGERRTCSLC